VLVESGYHPIELPLVARDGALELQERLSQLPGDVSERAGVLRQTRSTPTGAGREELRADARIQAEYAHHLVNVGPGGLTDVGHRVHETQSGGEERIGGMFGQFSGRNVSDDDRRVEHAIEVGKTSLYLRLRSADEDAIRVEEVPHRTSLAKEFRVGCHVDIIAVENRTEPYCGSDGHGGTCHHDRARTYDPSEFGDHRFDERQVGRAIVRLGGRYANEDDRRFARSFHELRRETQSASS